MSTETTCGNCIGMEEHGCFCQAMAGEPGVCEDDACNRVLGPGMICEGVMERYDDRHCSCHINPPCSNCVDAVYRCSECSFTTEPPEPDHSWITDDMRAVWAAESAAREQRDREWVEFMHLPADAVTKLDYRKYEHTHFSMRIEGRYPPGMSSADVKKKVNGTFGGRFDYFDHGRFVFIAHTD